MINFLKDKLDIFFFLLFAVSFSPLIVDLFHEEEPIAAKNELFNKELAKLNSVDKIVHYTDELYKKNHKKGLNDTASYVSTLSDVVKRRFYFNTSDYSLSENWIAYLCGKLIWSHMSSIVITNDILKHDKGLCSQQTIVFIAALGEKKINFRTVGLGYIQGPGHFVCEVKYGGFWHLYDVSKEPVWNRLIRDHQSLDYYLENKDTLYLAYESKISKAVFLKILEKHYYGAPNKMPAKNMILFHLVAYLIMYTLPLAFLLLSVKFYVRKHPLKIKSEALHKRYTNKATVLNSP